MNNAIDSDLITEICTRFEKIRSGILAACERSGRDPQSVRIVTVSKRHTTAVIRAAYACGLRIFGENYASELLDKKAILSDLADIQWEMIGHVQSRKAKLIANEVGRVHSVDSIKLAELLNRYRDSDLGPLEVLLEVNLSGEFSKSGVDGARNEQWGGILNLVDCIQELPGIKLTGLMTMPPLQEKMELNRPYFNKLRQLMAFINSERPGMKLSELSMGTSADFPVAIEEGATLIRLGESILGQRPVKE